MTSRVVLLLVAAMLGAAGPVARAQPADPEAARARLEALEAELAARASHQKELARQASALGREAEALARRAVALAAELQAIEERLRATLMKIESLEEMLAKQRAALAERRAQSAATLAALERLARRPAGLALLGPTDAGDTMRTTLLLRETVPALETIAHDLRQQLDRILVLSGSLAAEKETLASDLVALAASRAEAEKLRKSREAEQQQRLAEAEDEGRAIARIAREARSLEELLAALDAEAERRRVAAEAAARALGRLPPKPPASAPIMSARGDLPLPARGRLVRLFGDHDGPVSDKGITIATLPGAQVVAPYDGQVLFSGPFRGYGRLLIIDHGDGYHSLLAGMDRVDAVVGQWVLSGEPVGAMSGLTSGAAGIDRLGTSSAEGEPKLYVELRERGQPVDPLPWLASGAGKVS